MQCNGQHYLDSLASSDCVIVNSKAENVIYSWVDGGGGGLIYMLIYVTVAWR